MRFSFSFFFFFFLFLSFFFLLWVVPQGRVRVGQADDGDVDVRGLAHGLGVGEGVGHHQHARLHEGLLDLVGERAGREAAGHRRRANVHRELEHGALAIRASRDGADFLFGGSCSDGGGGRGGSAKTRPRTNDFNDTALCFPLSASAVFFFFFLFFPSIILFLIFPIFPLLLSFFLSFFLCCLPWGSRRRRGCGRQRPASPRSCGC